MSQWYVKVPAVGNANENCRPGPTIPEFHPLASEVVVWEMASVFVHVTVVPAAMSSSSGTKARFPSDWAPVGMVTDADVPPGAGAGAGAGDGAGDGVVGDVDEPPPQATAAIKVADTIARRNDNIGSSEHEVSETSAYNIPNLRAPSNIPRTIRSDLRVPQWVGTGISRGPAVFESLWTPIKPSTNLPYASHPAVAAERADARASELGRRAPAQLRRDHGRLADLLSAHADLGGRHQRRSRDSAGWRR